MRSKIVKLTMFSNGPGASTLFVTSLNFLLSRLNEMSPSWTKKLMKKGHFYLALTNILIFSVLGEASTTEIAVQKDARGFEENKEAAKMGGTIAGNARKELEEKSGRKVVSSSNFLSQKKRAEEIAMQESKDQ